MYSEHDYAECSLPNGKEAVFYYSPSCSVDDRKSYLLEVRDHGWTLMTFDFVMLCNLLYMQSSLKCGSLEEMSPWKVIEDADGNWRVCCGTDAMRHAMEKHGAKDIKGELTYEEAYQKLETIVKGLENGELSVDLLGARLKEARDLLAYCKERLLKAETDVKAVLDDEA